MPLLLKHVEPARGARWVRDAFALWARRPFAFTLMFVVFLAAAVVVTSVPFLGFALLFAMPPLLSLGFMVASQSALLDGPVTPLQFIEALRGDRRRRRSLLLLCALHALAIVGVLVVCVFVSNYELLHLASLVAKGNAPGDEIAAVAESPAISAAAFAWTVLVSLVSVLFWYAPALVHWGAQGVGQAIFSSTLGVWRNKGAFLVYGLVWVGVSMGTSIVTGLLVELAGAAGSPYLAMLPLLLLCTVFYVSLIFAFNDSFGGAQPRDGTG